MPRMRSSYWYAGLLLLTLVAYLPLWHNGYIDFDDELYITQNPRVLEGLTRSNIAWASTTLHGKYLQPVSWLSLQLDAQLFSRRHESGGPRLSAAAVHSQNLFWHTSSTLLLFALLRRLTGSPWRSFLVAGLFAVHPMHVESVAWAAERKDVLSVFFGLLTLYAYTWFVERPGWQRYLLMAAAFLLSLLSKPMLMSLPFVLLLLDYWPLRRLWPAGLVAGSASRPATSGRLILEKLPLFLMAAAIGFITLLGRERIGVAVSLSELPLSARLANAATAYGWYLASTFYPVNLAILYPHPLGNWSWVAALTGAGAVLVITLLSWIQARRWPWLITGWLWFVVALLPVIGLTQGGGQAWADRFSYWPHIGLFVAVVWGLGELSERLRVPTLAAGACVALLIGCLASLTWRQVEYWRDTPTLWERALAVTRDNHRAHLALGMHWQEQGALDKANVHLAEAVRILPESQDYRFAHGGVLFGLWMLDEAAECFRAALARDPNFADAWHNLGTVRLNQGKWSAAVRCYHRALTLRPESADTLAGLGWAYWRLGNRTEALRAFRSALVLNSKESLAWQGLGWACLVDGDSKSAAEHFEESLRRNASSVRAEADLGLALCRNGDWREGLDFLENSAQQQDLGEQRLRKMGGTVPTLHAIPYSVIFRCRLGFALNQVGDRQGAAEAYRAALKRDPDWPAKFMARAWALSTDPNPNLRDSRLAYELACQATQAVGDPSACMLDALAAAQAALGWFADAAQTARRALAKALASEETALAESIQNRLRLYEQGKPFIAEQARLAKSPLE
jgi:tetratricopeptide (TPR) repeat protein